MKEIFEFVRRRSTEENVSILLAEQNVDLLLIEMPTEGLPGVVAGAFKKKCCYTSQFAA